MADVVLSNMAAPRGSIISASAHAPTAVSFHKINYTVPVKVKRKTVEKKVLKDCTGIMRPGVNAILGPTGSGKTSLLDVLAARKDKRYLSGKVLVNGQLSKKNFRLMYGFVPQDDTVWATLSVRENLAFSAALRLSASYSAQERKERVEAIIDDLGLRACADTRMGNDERRGVSGGERKRTSIGMELITNPAVLFLDEPTTGLDATTAVTVIELLRKQAEQNRTVIFSIHQPRYSILKLFDHITLMSRGSMLYAGPPRGDMLQYFDELGYKCETYNNPADHVLDVIIQMEKMVKSADTGNENPEESETSGGKNLVEIYRKSDLFKNVFNEVDSSVKNLENGTETHVQQRLQYQASFFKQFRILSGRTMLNIVRDPRGVLSQFVVQVAIGLLIGAIFYNAGFGIGGLQNRIGFMFFMCTQMVWPNLSAITVFLEKRRIFRHEHGNGYYRVSAFFLSTIIFDMIPMRLVPTTTLATITYFLVGLKLEAAKFFIFLLTLLMVSLPAASWCMFAGSLTANYVLANLMATIPFILLMVIGGFMVRSSDIPVWLRWLQYFSVFKYGQNNLEINELQGMRFEECGVFRNETCGMSGDDHLLSQDLVISTETIWVNIGALAAIACGLLLFTYISLRKMKIYT